MKLVYIQMSHEIVDKHNLCNHITDYISEQRFQSDFTINTFVTNNGLCNYSLALKQWSNLD